MAPTSINTSKTKPEITSSSDIDLPFSDSPSSGRDVYREIELRNMEHSHNVEDLKNAIGKKLLYGCLIAIAVFAVSDAVWHIDSPIFTSAFEVAKVVATTVLGYLFGSRNKS